jgi:peroxiredoxin
MMAETIGPEDTKSFGDWCHAEHMPFTGILDPDHTIAKLYDQQFKPFKFGRMSAMVVIDVDGNIRYSHYGESMSDILLDEEIFSVLDKLNREK